METLFCSVAVLSYNVNVRKEPLSERDGNELDLVAYVRFVPIVRKEPLSERDGNLGMQK